MIKLPRKLLIITVISMLFVLSACNKDKTTREVSKSPERGEVSGNVKDGSAWKYRFPLTGLEASEKSSDRAVAVMINNFPQARPQSGLAEADIVYEVLAEGDITRFLAIYQSEKPERIGPVRSSRDYFIELAKGYDSFYVAHGYSPEALELLTNGYIDNINGMQYDGTLFKRSSDRQAPHNSYISYDNILKGAKMNNYKMNTPPDSLEFATEDEIKQISGEKAANVKVAYSKDPTFNAEYQYDEKTQKYKRFSDGEQTADLESNRPVLLDNLLIVIMNHKISDTYGRRDIDLTSGGKAYLLQKGTYREVEWRNENGKIIPYENGAPAKFIPGKTWINIVPDLKTVSFSE